LSQGPNDESFAIDNVEVLRVGEYGCPIGNFTRAATVTTSGYINEWDSAHDTNCGPGKAMVGIESVHNNGREDRRMKLKCADIDTTALNGLEEGTSFDVHHGETEYQDTWSLSCPTGSYMHGFSSYHDNGQEDRRFTFKCMSFANGGAGAVETTETDWMNTNDNALNYNVPDNTYLVGMESMHDSSHTHDRRFKFKYATLQGRPASCSNSCPAATFARNSTVTEVNGQETVTVQCGNGRQDGSSVKDRLNIIPVQSGTMSSHYNPAYPPSNCFDGNPSTFCHSQDDFANQFIRLDLGHSQPIESVKIWNRQDCCQNRFGAHVIETSNDDASWTTCFTGTLSTSTAPQTEACNVASARYVRVRMDGHADFLNLGDIQVQNRFVKKCTVSGGDGGCASLNCDVAGRSAGNIRGCDYQNCGYGDHFDVDTSDPNAPAVYRADSAGNSWGMNLHFQCTCDGFHNAWDGVQDSNCGPGKAMVGLHSVHNNQREDRRMAIRCAEIDGGMKASTEDFKLAETHWDNTWNLDCPTGSYMSGVASYHDNGREDRRFTFKCTKFNNANAAAVGYTESGFVNSLDGELDFTTPENTYLVGVESHHANAQEDRQFNFKYATLKGSGTDESCWTDADGSTAAHLTGHTSTSHEVQVDCGSASSNAGTGDVPSATCFVNDMTYDYITPVSASMSTQLSSTIYHASNCIDGNLDNFCHTGHGAGEDQWLKLDLGTAQPVGAVTIYNRKDCCQERLGDHLIQTSDDDINWTTCFSGTAPSSSTPITETCVSESARYVRIMADGHNEKLNLAEVRVHGHQGCDSLTCGNSGSIFGCNYQTCSYGDTFDVDTTNPNAPSVIRTDAPGNGWGMNLHFTCTCHHGPGA
jgi:hypothetical protein